MANGIAEPWYMSGMTALADRVERVLELREMSARDLSRRAGLHESHVGGIIRGTPEKQEGTSLGTLRQIADAAKVRLAWLAANEGGMLEPGAPDPGRFSSRLSQALRERGLEPAALDAAIGKTAGFTTRTWLRAQMRKWPHDDEVMAAAKVLHRSFEWLRYGIGDSKDPSPAHDATGTEHALKLSVDEPEMSATIRTMQRAIKPAPPKKRSATQRAKRRWKKP